MNKLKETGSLEFNMIYHVPNGVFEAVEITNAETKESLGKATFSTQSGNARARGGSPPARPTPAAARPAPAAARNNVINKTAANRGKSVAVSKINKARPAAAAQNNKAQQQ